MSTSSFAPDSPQLPPMPVDDITAPRRKRSIKKMPSSRTASSHPYTHTREESITPSIQPTSVVDAIAQTMVGEWMFKYVRRRKSFGVSESKDPWELGKNTDEMSANITSSGVRHKRWVWLAPYERAVMWSSKQPASGPALLGKSGRKCKGRCRFLPGREDS
jgi:Meiotic cell cortex C-terminal pleckstrin homology